MQPTKIELSHVTKAFSRPVLQDINLTVENGSYIAILGASGCGKSTLMNILGLVEERDGGSFVFNGTPIRTKRDYASLRRKHIGFIFQSYNLIPTLSCLENIRMPLLYAPKTADISAELMCRLGIEHLRDQRVNTLSGGEKQRVAIARAMMLEPSLLLADEPSGNLDRGSSEIIFHMFAEEQQKGRAIVMITHDAAAAAQASTVLHLKGGVLHEA